MKIIVYNLYVFDFKIRHKLIKLILSSAVLVLLDLDLSIIQLKKKMNRQM